ncbi:MAG: MFS transporter [Peptococcaceae bacterium]|nr:MFS transporter [Peptococcaceae bacterium]
MKEMILVTKTKNNSMAIILTLSLAALIECMNMTLFNVAMPALMIYFDTTVTKVQWLSSGFTLAAGIVTPLVGFLGDKFGYKRTLNIVSLLILVLSVIGMFSWCIETLIVVRIFFGLTAGMLMPLSMAMLYRIIPRADQAKAAGLLGTANIFGGLVPSVLSGIIVTYLDWRILLCMMVVLALLLLVCSIKFIPVDDANGQMKLDGIGFAVTTVGSFVLLFSFSNFAAWGMSSQFITMMLIGVFCMAVYVKKSWNSNTAMLNLSVLKYPRYVAALIADCMNIIGLYMITFVMPLMLQNGLNFSAALTGFVMLPASAVSIIAMPFATKILTKQGEKALAIIGVLFMIVGSAVFLDIDPHISVIVVVAAMCVRSFGMGFLNLMTTNTCMAAVPAELSGHASALTNWVRQMISALVISVASTIISIRLTASGAQTAEEISAVYLSSSEMLFALSCLSLLIIIPIAMKFFRGKNEMNN